MSSGLLFTWYSLTLASSKAINDAGDYADAPKFYEYLLNKVTIHFKDRNNPDSEEGSFSLELSKKMLYNQVTQKVAEHLKAPADHLRFSGVTSTNGKPRAFIRPATTLTLTNMVAPPYSGYSSGMALQSSDSLYYEVLELSLTELDSKKLMRVTLLSEGITKEVRCASSRYRITNLTNYRRLLSCLCRKLVPSVICSKDSRKS